LPTNAHTILPEKAPLEKRFIKEKSLIIIHDTGSSAKVLFAVAVLN